MKSLLDRLPKCGVLTRSTFSTETEQFSTVTNLLKRYFDTMYCLCCCPFHLIRVAPGPPKFSNLFQRENVFHKQGNWIQNISCVILLIIDVPWLFRDITTFRFLLNSLKNPTVHFLQILKTTHSIQKAILVKLFWWNNHEIQYLLNLIHSVEEELGKSKSRLGRNFVALLLCFGYTGAAILEVITGAGIVGLDEAGHFHDQSEHWWWWSAMVKAGRSNMFLGNSSRGDSEEFSIQEHIIAGFTAIGWIHS